MLLLCQSCLSAIAVAKTAKQAKTRTSAMAASLVAWGGLWAAGFIPSISLLLLLFALIRTVIGQAAIALRGLAA